MNVAKSGPRIAATIGQGTCSESMLRVLAEAGVRVFRYNLAAQIGYERNFQRMAAFRSVRASLNSEIFLMLDLPLPGAKFRIGMLPEPRHLINAGTVLTFRSGVETSDISCGVPVQAPALGTKVVAGQTVTVGDGELSLQVIDIVDEDSFTARALTTHYLPCQKSLNIGHTASVDLDEAEELISFVADARPDFIALSFVEEPADSALVFDRLAKCGLHRDDYSAIAKIETLRGVHNVAEIAKHFDMLMVARGDLALNIDYCYLGEVEEHLIKEARRLGVACMVATQICESSASSAIPNRAELSGMYSLAKREVDYVLLAKETSSLPNPLAAVDVLRNVLEAAKRPLFSASLT
ncbi:MAG: pyruvate kinase [Burkholderiaceae bacterium]